MRLITGDKPASVELRLDSLMVAMSRDPAQVIGGSVIAALKKKPEVLAEATSMVITIEVGQFAYEQPTD